MLSIYDSMPTLVPRFEAHRIQHECFRVHLSPLYYSWMVRLYLATTTLHEKNKETHRPVSNQATTYELGRIVAAVLARLMMLKFATN